MEIIVDKETWQSIEKIRKKLPIVLPAERTICVLLQIRGSAVRGTRLRQLEENAGSRRQLRHSSLFQQGHSQPRRVAAPFTQRLNDSSTLPDDGSPRMRTGHMGTWGEKCWITSALKLLRVLREPDCSHLSPHTMSIFLWCSFGFFL